MEQSAVEFLYKSLEGIRMDYNQKKISAEQAINSRAEVLESANEMFKKQIIDSYRRSTYQFEVDAKINCRTAEEYYNETFNKPTL